MWSVLKLHRQMIPLKPCQLFHTLVSQQLLQVSLFLLSLSPETWTAANNETKGLKRNHYPALHNYQEQDGELLHRSQNDGHLNNDNLLEIIFKKNPQMTPYSSV